EINHPTHSFARLKQDQAKFKACIENVAEMEPENQGAKATLVPLTNCSYVHGKISDPEHILVDMGTGYFISKGYRLAHRLRNTIKQRSISLEDMIQNKRDNTSAAVNVIQ
ncbi:hypothetical protein BT96DRAFT_784402, partial [Gymnopus androsaceus JB14]